MKLPVLACLPLVLIQAQSAPPSADFGQVNVGSNSAQVLTFTFNSLSQPPSFSLRYNLDFAIENPVCSIDGSSCTLSIRFSPKSAGLRQDSVIARTPAGAILKTQFLQGTGLAPLMIVSPGTTKKLSWNGAFKDHTSLVFDMVGNLYTNVVDSGTITKIDLQANTSQIIAGGPNASGSAYGENVSASSAIFAAYDLALDAGGNLYLSETVAGRVRRIDAQTGLIRTVAGSGSRGYAGDGGPATSAWLSSPTFLAIDADGNIFITDGGNHAIRKVDANSGLISTVAGTGRSGFSGDGGLASAAQLNNPHGIALDAEGNLLIADTGNERIRQVNLSSGVITTIAGSGVRGVSGNGGDPLAAQFGNISALKVDPSGGIFIDDGTGDQVVRYLSPDRSSLKALYTVPYSASGGLALDNAGAVYRADYTSIYKNSSAGGNLYFTAPVGATAASPVTVLNIGTSPLNLSGLSITGINAEDYSFNSHCGTNVAPGVACSIDALFSPRAITSRQANLNISAMNTPGSPAAVSLSGLGLDALQITSDTVPATDANISSGLNTIARIVNTSGLPVAINSINITNQHPGLYFNQTNDCPQVLPANGACMVSITYRPPTYLSGSTTLEIFYGPQGVVQTKPIAALPILIPGTVNVYPRTLAFASQPILQWSAEPSVTIFNRSPSSVTMSVPTITGPDANDFFAYTTCTAYPLFITGSCDVRVRFLPTQAGRRTATLRVSNSLSGEQQIELVGDASLPSQFEIVNAATGKVLGVGDDIDGTPITQSFLTGKTKQAWSALLQPDGSYQIFNYDTGKSLDVKAASTGNGAVVQQYTSWGGGNQRWRLIPIDEVHYKIVNVGSGKVLDVALGSSADGSPLQQWDYNGSKQQWWTLVPVTSFALTNFQSGSTLSPVGSSLASGALIEQVRFSARKTQQWQLLPVGNGYYAFLNRFTGRVLDVNGASNDNTAAIQQYDYFGGANQEWKLAFVSLSGTFSITNRLNGKALDLPNGSAKDGTTIQQYTYLGTANQQWRIQGSLSYRILNSSTNKSLDVPGGSDEEGLAIQQWSFSGALQQQWMLVRNSNSNTPLYWISNVGTGKVLEVADSNDGSRVRQAEFTGKTNQLWTLWGLTQNLYIVLNYASGRALDLQGGSLDDGALIQQYHYVDSRNQVWLIGN